MHLAGLSGSWIAIQARPRLEPVAASGLRERGYEVLLPLSSGDNKTLFPGYLFCRFDASVRVPIVTAPGVVRIVGYGHEPVRIDDWEIDAVRAVAESGLPVRPHLCLRVGQWVKVREGPLKGAVGRVAGSGRKKPFVVSVNVLHRAISVEVDEDWLEPMPGPPDGSPEVPLSAGHIGEVRNGYSN